MERPPILLRITESLPRKSAVSPVYNSPPAEREEPSGRERDRMSVILKEKEIWKNVKEKHGCKVTAAIKEKIRGK